MTGLHELADLVRRHLGATWPEGAGPMLVPGLHLIGSTAVTEAQQLVYEPMLCIILEGAKNTTLGPETHTYRAGQYLAVSADLPVSGQVIAAPYLAVGVPLDPAMIAALLVETGGTASETVPVRALAVSDMDDDLIDTVARLVRLLDRPRETSLHRHFKAVTAMSPLQYQKQVRLQEARNLLLSRGRDMAAIGFAVGYDSPSQFSREYSRLFGQPPGRDLERLRADPSLAVAI